MLFKQRESRKKKNMVRVDRLASLLYLYRRLVASRKIGMADKSSKEIPSIDKSDICGWQNALKHQPIWDTSLAYMNPL